MRIAIVCILAACLGGCSALGVHDASRGITGTVRDGGGLPVADAYAYLYRSRSSGLIGPSDFMERTDEGGRFAFDVPDGSYWLVVRKRARGGDSGPPREGDRTAVYGRNPVIAGPGGTGHLELVLPERTTNLQKRMPSGNTPVEVRLGGPMPSRALRLLIYEGEELKAAPRYLVELAAGAVTVLLERGHRYVLVIREGARERVMPGELFAKSQPFMPEELTAPIVLSPEPSP